MNHVNPTDSTIRIVDPNPQVEVTVRLSMLEWRQLAELFGAKPKALWEAMGHDESDLKFTPAEFSVLCGHLHRVAYRAGHAVSYFVDTSHMPVQDQTGDPI